MLDGQRKVTCRSMFRLVLLSSMFSFGGCAREGTATAAVIPEGKGLLVSEQVAGNVTLYVSTEGTELEPVDLEVNLDGSPIIRGDFGEGSLHPFFVEYRFDWSPGMHNLSVASSTAADPTTLQVDIDGDVWIVVTYGYEPGKGLAIRAYDQPVGWL